MKALTYILVAVLGAAAASWITWQLIAPSEGETDARIVITRVESVPTQPPLAELNPASVERLAREKAESEAEVETLRVRLAKLDGELARTRESLEELRRPLTSDLLSSALRAELKSGEVVVTGGYALADGTRLYAFMQPVLERVDGEDVVRITSTFRTLDDAVGRKVGLDNLATNAANTLQHGEVWIADEQRQVFEALDADMVGGLVNGPAVTMRPGESTWIEVGTMRLKVTPALTNEPGRLDFEVRLEQPQTAPVPAVAVE